VTKQQWRAVEAIVLKEQITALQHMNKHYYEELKEILDELYVYAHSSE